MKIQTPIELSLIAQPDNPPEGKVLLYMNALTGKPVWHDKDGVHLFVNLPSVIVSATEPTDSIPGDIWIKP